MDFNNQESSMSNSNFLLLSQEGMTRLFMLICREHLSHVYARVASEHFMGNVLMDLIIIFSVVKLWPPHGTCNQRYHGRTLNGSRRKMAIWFILGQTSNAIQKKNRTKCFEEKGSRPKLEILQWQKDQLALKNNFYVQVLSSQ